MDTCFKHITDDTHRQTRPFQSAKHAFTILFYLQGRNTFRDFFTRKRFSNKWFFESTGGGAVAGSKSSSSSSFYSSGGCCCCCCSTVVVNKGRDGDDSSASSSSLFIQSLLT